MLVLDTVYLLEDKENRTGVVYSFNFIVQNYAAQNSGLGVMSLLPPK